MAGENEYEDFINGLTHGCYDMSEEESACEAVAFPVPVDENGGIDFSKL